MKLEGNIKLDMTDIKAAIAQYIEREYQLATKVAHERIGLYPVDSPDWGFFASVNVGVAIIDVESPLTNGERA